MYRVYLLPEWREFGIDYPAKDRAEQAAARYRISYPHHRYVVRRVLLNAQNRRSEKTATNPERS